MELLDTLDHTLNCSSHPTLTDNGVCSCGHRGDSSGRLNSSYSRKENGVAFVLWKTLPGANLALGLSLLVDMLLHQV